MGTLAAPPVVTPTAPPTHAVQIGAAIWTCIEQHCDGRHHVYCSCER